MKTQRVSLQAARVEALRSYEVLNTAKEQAFDDFALFAAHICQTPMAFITFLDGERFWYKSSIGVCITETPRPIAFCSHTVDKAGYFSINDTSTDERFSTNPSVVSEPYIRFYAGMPLLTSEGIVIGTICVADRIPRELSPEQINYFLILSRQIISRLELRKNVASLSPSLRKLKTTRRETPTLKSIPNKKIIEELRESEARNHILAEMVSDNIITIDEDNTILFANRAMEKLFGYNIAELNGTCLTILMPKRLHHLHEAGMRRFIEMDTKRSSWQLVEFIGQRKNGEEFMAEISFGEHLEDGKYYFTGVIRDVSERRMVNTVRESEEALQQATVELELRVSRRTAELAEANRVLQVETVMRQTAEDSHVHLLHRLVGVQEEERGRIARELHDKMGQYLTGLILGLHSLTDICQPHPPSHKHLLYLLQVADEMMCEVHHLAWKLRPAALNDLGLKAALGNYLTQWSERTNIALDFHSGNLDEQLLPQDIENTVYRIVQEALTNIFKHAQAKHVSVVIGCQQNNVQVIVEDNGKGFNTEYLYMAMTEGWLGVVGMQERAAMVEGTVNIESTLGAGTAVFLRIPLPLAVVPGGNAYE